MNSGPALSPAGPAVTHLASRVQRVCDALGNHGRTPNWTLADVTAVRTLISERKSTRGDRPNLAREEAGRLRGGKV